jgi:hypothetical protein
MKDSNLIVSVENRNREIFRVFPEYRDLSKEDKFDILNELQKWINDETEAIKELKPCPFCGKSIQVQLLDEEGNFREDDYLEEVIRNIHKESE